MRLYSSSSFAHAEAAAKMVLNALLNATLNAELNALSDAMLDAVLKEETSLSCKRLFEILHNREYERRAGC